MKKVHFLKALAVLAVSVSAVSTMQTAQAVSNNNVLVITETVFGSPSVEAAAVLGLGLNPVEISSAGFDALTAAQIAENRAVIAGDRRCSGNINSIASLGTDSDVSGQSDFSEAVTGMVVIAGNDPAWHQAYGSNAFAAQATVEFVTYAVGDPDNTGAYVSMSCYHFNGIVNALAGLGDGDFVLSDLGSDTAVVLNGDLPLTSAGLSNWYTSIHEVFTEIPSDFNVFAIANNFYSGDTSSNTDFTDADGVVHSGVPYIVTRESSNEAPVCDVAIASTANLWPVNHDFVKIDIDGVTDPEEDEVSIQVTSVVQDQVVSAVGNGSGNTEHDARNPLDADIEVRAERAGTDKSGRIYTIAFTATDAAGGSCSSEVEVCVPHSNKSACTLGSQSFNSFTGDEILAP